MARHMIDGLIHWAERDEWSDSFADHFGLHIGPACMDAEIQPDDLLDMLDETHARNVWGVVFEDFATYTDESGRNLIDDYLKRRGFMESPAAKQYIKALRHSHMSLYEISDVVHDTGFMARDMLADDAPFMVYEKSGTHGLKQWDILAARIVTVTGRTQMCGGCLVFDRTAANNLIDLLKIIGEEKQSSIAEILPGSAFVFTNFWITDVLDRMHNGQNLVNSDGDQIEFITLRYPLTSGVKKADIVYILDSMEELRPQDESLWDWLSPEAGDNQSGDSGSTRFVSFTEDGMTVLGQIELKGRNLFLTVNSANRSERGRVLLETILGERIGTARAVSENRQAANRPSAHQLQLSVEDQQEFMDGFLDQHYRKTLDTPLPMLNGLSPREAANNEASRASVVDWLKYIENGSAKNDASVYDMSWMWEELGLGAYRK